MLQKWTTLGPPGGSQVPCGRSRFPAPEIWPKNAFEDFSLRKRETQGRRQRFPRGLERKGVWAPRKDQVPAGRALPFNRVPWEARFGEDQKL